MSCERNSTSGYYNPNAGLIKIVSKILKDYLFYSRREEAFHPPLKKTILKNPSPLTQVKDLPSSLHHRTVNYLLNGSRLHVILGYLVKLRQLSQREKEVRQILCHHLFCGSTLPRWETESEDQSSEIKWGGHTESRMDGKYRERWGSSKCLTRVPQGVTQRLVNMAARLLVATDSVGFKRHDCELLEKGLQKLIMDRKDSSERAQEKPNEVKSAKWCKPRSKMPSCCYPTCLLTQMKSSQECQPTKKKRRSRTRHRKKQQKSSRTDRCVQTESELWDPQKDLRSLNSQQNVSRSALPDFVPRPSSAYIKRTPIDNYTTTLVSTDSLEEIYEYDDDDGEENNHEFITVINGSSDEGIKNKKENADDSKIAVDDRTKSGQSSGYCSIANISVHTSFEQEENEEDKCNASASVSAAQSNSNVDTDAVSNSAQFGKEGQETDEDSGHQMDISLANDEVTDSPDKAEISAVSEKVDESEPSDKEEVNAEVEKEENSDASGKVEEGDQSERAEEYDQSEKAEEYDQSEKAEECDQSEKAEESDQSEQVEETDQSEKAEESLQSEKVEASIASAKVEESVSSAHQKGNLSDETSQHDEAENELSSLQSQHLEAEIHSSQSANNDQTDAESSSALLTKNEPSEIGKLSTSPESTVFKESIEEAKSSDESGENVTTKTSEEQCVQEESELHEDYTSTTLTSSTQESATLKESSELKSSDEIENMTSKTSEEPSFQEGSEVRENHVTSPQLSEHQEQSDSVKSDGAADRTECQSPVKLNKMNKEHLKEKRKLANFRSKKTLTEQSTVTSLTSSDDEDIPESSSSEECSSSDLSDEENDITEGSQEGSSSKASSLKETDGSEVSEGEEEEDDSSSYLSDEEDEEEDSEESEREEDASNLKKSLSSEHDDVQEEPHNMVFNKAIDYHESSDNMDGDSSDETEDALSEIPTRTTSSDQTQTSVESLPKPTRSVSPMTTVHMATRSGDLTTVKALVEQDRNVVETVDEKGWTPLHVAASLGHTNIVLFFADVGSDLQALDPSGYTALHLSAMEGYEEIIQILLDRNIEVNITTSDGFTPLHLAVLNNHLHCCKTLLSAGASMEALDGLGRNTVEMANEYSAPDVKNLLNNMHEYLSRFHNLVQVLADASSPSKHPSETLPPNVLEVLVDLAAEEEDEEQQEGQEQQQEQQQKEENEQENEEQTQ